MSSAEIPAAIEQFIRNNIHSLEQLEVLLLLRSSPDEQWTSEKVGDILRTSHPSAKARLEDLCSTGLLKMITSSELRFQYAPATASVSEAVDQLAKLYKERRVTIVSLIYPPVRRDLQAFSDAFRVRKKKED